MIHLRNRDYSPNAGTFTTVDPIDGQPGTTTVANPYAYVGNDPLNFTDPLGLCRTTDVLFDASTNVDSVDAFVVGGPTSGLGYDECNNRDDVLCVSQGFEANLGDYGVAPVKCGPHQFGDFTDDMRGLLPYALKCVYWGAQGAAGGAFVGEVLFPPGGGVPGLIVGAVVGCGAGIELQNIMNQIDEDTGR